MSLRRWHWHGQLWEQVPSPIEARILGWQSYCPVSSLSEQHGSDILLKNCRVIVVLIADAGCFDRATSRWPCEWGKRDSLKTSPAFSSFTARATALLNFPSSSWIVWASFGYACSLAWTWCNTRSCMFRITLWSACLYIHISCRLLSDWSSITNRWMLLSATKAVLMFRWALRNLFRILLSEFFDFNHVLSDTLKARYALIAAAFQCLVPDGARIDHFIQLHQRILGTLYKALNDI